MVVDSAGKPLAGVRVFNAGEAVQTLGTRTNSAGRFWLQGLRAGRVFVFAEKPDHRFTGVRTTAGATDIVVRLLRKDEPVPTRPARPEPMSVEEQQRLARRLLEKLWAEMEHRNLSRAILPMGRLDPQQALKWSAELGGSYDASIRALMAEKIADQNLDEAFGLLNLNDKRLAVSTCGKLARRFVVVDAAKAVRCAQEMVKHARALREPDQTVYLAQAGTLMIRLGTKSAGVKLVEEAAERLPDVPVRSLATARSYVAEGIACYDLKRAMALLDTPAVTAAQPAASAAATSRAAQIERGEQFRCRSRIAIALCLKNLDQALEIVGTMDPSNSWRSDETRLRIACLLAPTRPRDAVRVVQTMGTGSKPPSDSRPDIKAMGMGWLATAIPWHDKPLACSLIDEGLANVRSRDLGHQATKAAFLAVQARAIGYPDIEIAIWQVLASRPTTRNSWFIEQNVVMATLLAALP